MERDLNFNSLLSVLPFLDLHALCMVAQCCTSHAAAVRSCSIHTVRYPFFGRMMKVLTRRRIQCALGEAKFQEVKKLHIWMTMMNDRVAPWLCVAVAAKVQEMSLICSGWDMRGVGVCPPCPRLTKITLSGSQSMEVFAWLAASCGATLREFRVDHFGLPCSEEEEEEEDAFYPPADCFEQLEVVEFKCCPGICRYFSHMSRSAAPTLKRLVVDNSGFDFDTRGVEGDFFSLQTLELEGRHCSDWLASLAQTCAPSLRHLRVEDSGIWVPTVPGQFLQLESVTFWGCHCGTAFASMSASCAPTLRHLNISTAGSEGVTFPGEFGRLEVLHLDGCGIFDCFSSMAPSCSGSVRIVTLIGRRGDDERPDRVDGLTWSCPKLTSLSVTGNGSSKFFERFTRCEALRELHIEDDGLLSLHDATTQCPSDVTTEGAALPSLRSLKVFGVGVSNEFRDRLRKAAPLYFSSMAREAETEEELCMLFLDDDDVVAAAPSFEP
eukprot:GHVU01098121.1.p1 GENE.GHVU01098121.1~~GHVU01098121.1.p1  ORF type:complete len:494 (-),score=63.39 GHVU01098121.1:203-1684(-)